jgi:hypothetical protein
MKHRRRRGISDGAGTVKCGLDCGLRFLGQHPVTYWRQMVGLGGLEPPTSPLSGARSSHLSYRPDILAGNTLTLSRVTNQLKVRLASDTQRKHVG